MTLILVSVGKKKRLEMEGVLSQIKVLLIKTDVKQLGTAEKKHSK